jgi:hypothetical protein
VSYLHSGADAVYFLGEIFSFLVLEIVLLCELFLLAYTAYRLSSFNGVIVVIAIENVPALQHAY